MPIIESAKKRVRVTARQTEENRHWKNNMKSAIKEFKTVMAEEPEQEEAQQALDQAFKMIDKATRHNIIHENNAARKKSRLHRKFNQKFADQE